jgi:hypothetical protein
MVKVTMKRLRTGLTGATGLALLHGNAACTAPTAPTVPEGVGHTAAAVTTDAAPTGTLTLGWSLPTETNPEAFLVQGPVDEFLRVGDPVTFSLSAYSLWNILYPTTAEPADTSRVTELKATFAVQFLSNGEVVGSTRVAVSSWDVAAPFAVNGTSGAFVIPPTTDTLLVELTVADEGGDASVELSSVDFAPVPVFGGQYPLKHLLFDNDGSTLRQRIIEGGTLLSTNADQASIAFSITDWRADEIVQRTLLDTQIGTEQSEGRFGPLTVALQGQVVYEIAVGYSFDGVNFYEAPLTANASPRVLEAAPGRTAYETLINPSPASETLNLYVHVKAYLVADYSSFTGQNINAFYAQGARVLLAEKWDNPGGQSFANYTYPVVLSPVTP